VLPGCSIRAAASETGITGRNGRESMKACKALRLYTKNGPAKDELKAVVMPMSRLAETVNLTNLTEALYPWPDPQRPVWTV